MAEGSARDNNSDAAQTAAFDAWAKLNPAAAAQEIALSNYENGSGNRPENAESGWNAFMNKALPVASTIMGGAAFAPAVAGALGAMGVTAAPVVGAAQGALTGTMGAGFGVTGQNVGKAALTGAIAGGLGSLAKPAVGALSNATGLGATASNALVKGAIGAGVGAIGSKIGGGSPANGAIIGGLGGAASGALGSATGSPTLGNVGGTIAANLANKYLTTPVTPKPVAAAPAAVPKPTATTGNVTMPSLPPVSGMPGTPPPTVAPAAPPTNIGSYSGYGYVPRTQTNPNIDYANYGQGPEAQFFTGETGAPAAAAPKPTATATQGMPSTPTQRI